MKTLKDFIFEENNFKFYRAQEANEEKLKVEKCELSSKSSSEQMRQNTKRYALCPIKFSRMERKSFPVFT